MPLTKKYIMYIEYPTEVIMSKSIFQKSLPTRQPQPLRYKIENIGYMPFTQKLIDENIPIYRYDNNKHTANASHHGFSFYNIDGSIDVYSSSDIESRYIIEHEGVHVNQRKFETAPSHYFYGAYDYIAYERLIELEAYTREDHKILHDYYNNILTLEEMIEHNLIDESLNELVGLITGQSTITSKEQLLDSLDEIRQDDYFPSEETVLIPNMIKLSTNSHFMDHITYLPIQNLTHIYKNVKDIPSRHSPQTCKTTFEKAGLDLCSCFSGEFGLDQAHTILNRDGTDYFTGISLSTQYYMMDNLFTFTPAQLDKIKAATSSLRAFNQ